MSRMIFVNLPVKDLERSTAFYEAIGFRNEPKFSNDVAAMMVLSDTISVMLLTHPFYATFTRKPIADSNNSSQVILCISCDSPFRSRPDYRGCRRGGWQDRRLAGRADEGRTNVRPRL